MFAKWMHARGHSPEPAQVVALDALFGLGKGGANALTIDWLEEMGEAGLAPRTIARRLASLKSAVGMACDALDLIPWKLSIKAPKVGRPVKDTRGPGDNAVARVLRHVLEVARDGKASSARNAAMLVTMAMHGLRRIELLRLRVCDVKLGENRVWIQGKGQSDRESLTLVPESAAALGAWLALRDGEGNAPLFVSVDRHGNQGSKRMASSTVELITKSAAKAINENHTHNPHSWRHTAISRCARVTGGDVAKVAAFSRHKDLRTVSVYLDDVTDNRGQAATAVAGGWI